MTATIPREQADPAFAELGLDLCEALYWLRVARRRKDDVQVAIWTERLDTLLEDDQLRVAA